MLRFERISHNPIPGRRSRGEYSGKGFGTLFVEETIDLLFSQIQTQRKEAKVHRQLPSWLRNPRKLSSTERSVDGNAASRDYIFLCHEETRKPQKRWTLDHFSTGGLLPSSVRDEGIHYGRMASFHVPAIGKQGQKHGRFRGLQWHGRRVDIEGASRQKRPA